MSAPIALPCNHTLEAQLNLSDSTNTPVMLYSQAPIHTALPNGKLTNADSHTGL